MTWQATADDVTTFHYRQPDGSWLHYTRIDKYIRPSVMKPAHRTPTAPCPASHGHTLESR